MTGDEETIIAAACALLFRSPFVTASRRLIHWNQIKPDGFPCIFLRQTGFAESFGDDTLARTTLNAEIWLYQRVGMDAGTIPATALNALVKAVRAALAPDDYHRGVNTLGGLVLWCRLEGDGDYDPGDEDGLAKAILPLRILVP